MKRKLLLFRHAKSSWNQPELDDRDRPLNDRGRKSVKLIARRLRKEDLTIDAILCSTSVRTRQTAELVFAKWYERPDITFLDELYHATPDEIRQIVAQVPALAETVLVIGHNPGFEELLAELTEAPQKFSTAALAHVELELEEWREFDSTTRGELAQMWRPKELERD